MELQDFAAIFGEPKVDWLNRGSLTLHPFLFYLHSPNTSLLRFYVSDFHCNTWEATRSLLQLEDMRDEIGIGGAMSEFVNYIITSLKFGDVKLSLDGQSGKDGAASYAKLIAQKSKGMPVFSISLTRLMDSAASEAVAILSFGLFNALKDMQCSLLKEQVHALQLTNIISAEKEKSESIQSKLGQYTKRQKLHQNTSANGDVSAASLSTGLQHSPAKPVVHDIGSTKVTNRVVPAFRRAKTRGALLQDSEDDSEQECSLQLTKTIPYIKEESKNIQNQLGKNTKIQDLQNQNTLVNADMLQSSPDKPIVHEVGSTKVTNCRRGKTRGAILQDSEDDNGK